MNKKGTKIYDDKEDKTIKKVAHSRSQNYSNIILLFILIVLFGFTLYCTLVYVGGFYKEKEDLRKSSEIIEIKTNKGNAVITNTGKIERSITGQDIINRENVVLENVTSIELNTNSSSDSDAKFYFDVKYNIKKNDFPYHIIATNDSDILVRFSYSFDNENWTYVNNVISTNDSTLNPMMGSYYDIAGLTTTLKVSTNHVIAGEPGTSKKMYWKSETFMLTKDSNLDKGIEAEFKIEYKDND